MCHIFFIHSSVDGHLGCFNVLAIVNTSAHIFKVGIILDMHFGFHDSFFKIYLFYLIYFWLFWAFVVERGLSLVAVSGAYSSLWCVGFLLQWLLLLRSSGSRHVGFSSCGALAQ